MSLLKRKYFIMAIMAIVFIGLSINARTSKDQPDERKVGYEYLDNDKVLHFWNEIDDYYLNTSSGIQFTNHYQDYWTKNIFCGGIKGTNWQFYCIDSIPFSYTIKTDNATFINITYSKTVSNVNFKLVYHLANNDTNMTINPSIENNGVFNVQEAAFLWKIKDIKIDNSQQNDWLLTNGSHYDLNKQNELFFKNVSGAFYRVYDNITGKWLLLAWDYKQKYNLTVKSEAGQYNNPVTLAINLGSILSGSSKSIFFYWIDAGEQFARPNTDIATGGWTNILLWTYIDETTPNDADFITSSNNPAADIFEVGLTDTIIDPEVSTGHIMRMRSKRSNTDSFNEINFVLRLKQGGTTIKTSSGQMQQAFTTDSYTLSAAEANSITDYNALSFEVQADLLDFGEPTSGLAGVVSWMELEVPTTAAHNNKIMLKSDGLIMLKSDGLIILRN